MKSYAGLDVSLRSVAICVIDIDGRVVLERSVGCEVAEIVAAPRMTPHEFDLFGFEA